MSDSKIADRKAEIKKEFVTLDKEHQGLVQERAKLDRRLSEIRDKVNRLDAAYVELLRIEPDEVPATETSH
jgi:hypothetical protein